MKFAVAVMETSWGSVEVEANSETKPSKRQLKRIALAMSFGAIPSVTSA